MRARSAELAKVETEAAVLRARVHAEVYNVLTPEQQEKAKALRAEREARGAEHREQWKNERQDRLGEAVGARGGRPAAAGLPLSPTDRRMTRLQASKLRPPARHGCGRGSIPRRR